MQLTKTLVTLILAATVAVAAPAPCADCGDLVARDAEAEAFPNPLAYPVEEDIETIDHPDEADLEERDDLEARKTTGAMLFNQAWKHRNAPYVSKGGNCKGATNTTITGKKGFDNAGLTLFTICSQTRINLPHTPKGQYLSRRGRRVPKARRAKGDLVFYGKEPKCLTGPTQVGIIKDGKSFLWYPSTVAGTKARLAPLLTRLGKLHMCPQVLRFW